MLSINTRPVITLSVAAPLPFAASADSIILTKLNPTKARSVSVLDVLAIGLAGANAAAHVNQTAALTNLNLVSMSQYRLDQISHYYVMTEAGRAAAVRGVYWKVNGQKALHWFHLAFLLQLQDAGRVQIEVPVITEGKPDKTNKMFWATQERVDSLISTCTAPAPKLYE